jgi:O-antigen biosynthesis protein
MDPIVSILIPAYRPRFFAAALASARAQTYPALEIVVGDDSPDGRIAREVGEAADPRIRYERHVPALGFAGNFTRTWQLARGEYVKFLNDDDLLAPDCVARLAAALSANPQASEPPEFHAALRQFLPRIPARYLEPQPGRMAAGIAADS